MNFEIVSRCPVLKGIDSELLKLLFEDLHYKIKTYEKDLIVISSGERCNNLMILLEGEVRGEMLDFSGNSIKIEDIMAPRPIAPAFLFGEMNLCPVTVIANEFTRILFIPREEVLRLMQRNSTILLNYLNILSGRGQFLSDKVKMLSFKNLKQKIAYYLLKENPGGLIKSQQEFADLLAVARPSLARTFGEMEAEGLVKYNRGRIEVINKEKLNDCLFV
ncbi:MAG: Crp/Fnr family transcriptional regulator [Bacteroidales bacterium]|nr:Crp/Fnr family transcriptional regulator [Bacteroidales bacterium]